MGRWGKGIYQSDGALDYFSLISDRIEREFAFQFSPERVTAEHWWVIRVIKLIEVVLLLHQHGVINVLYFDNLETVKRWQKTFFAVWDFDWKSTGNPPFDQISFRIEKRPIVERMFSQLEIVVESWVKLSPLEIDLQTLLTPTSKDSISRSKTDENLEYVFLDRFIFELIEQLVKDIIYWLSPEKRAELHSFFGGLDDPVVAVDVLGCLCEAYQTTPGMKAKVIHAWKDSYIQIMKEVYEESKLELDETGERFKSIVAAFDKLEMLANKYPPEDWWE
ncbi:MAG: hypothetical protein GC179_06395 [Anaerolineaceae bacterium]|nr:hypothetical protein [Anaerolineaceae bacterium]